jgi:hypothetical protein
MIIHITKEDLENSQYNSTRGCACAKAVRRVSTDPNIFVGGSFIFIGNKKYKIPKRATEELIEVMVENRRIARSFWFNAREVN